MASRFASIQPASSTGQTGMTKLIFANCFSVSSLELTFCSSSSSSFWFKLALVWPSLRQGYFVRSFDRRHRRSGDGRRRRRRFCLQEIKIDKQ